jgi:predicted dehydrogenase
MAGEVRMGVVGLGNMGGYHADYLSKGAIKGARLAAVCDIQADKLSSFRGNDARKFEDSGKMLRSGLVDAVIIATPHYAHTTVGIDAFQNGVNVLTEKPISVHKRDCEKLIAAHKASRGKVFGAMFQMRTVPITAKVRSMVKSGELGEIRRMNWIVTDWFRSQAYYSSGGWRATWRGEGGGVLMNQCPHNLDLLQWICGMPSKVEAHCAFGKFHDIEVEDEVTAYLEFPNGATGVFITTTGEAPGTNRLEIAGDMGKLVMEGGKLRFTRNEVNARKFCKTTREIWATPGVWDVEIPVRGSGGRHEDITQNFVDAVKDGVPLFAPGVEGINSVELANSMVFSSLEGKAVKLPLNSKVYESRLMKLVAKSRMKKEPKRTVRADMEGSFK